MEYPGGLKATACICYDTDNLSKVWVDRRGRHGISGGTQSNGLYMR
ncbi:hypothetical protein QUF70_18805 [Desulfobacterales bacterium HSG17]|nr:hypothetical protein [Desulfobacterales bacterium HSG17]